MFQPNPLLSSKNKEIGKLFCLGYIKTFCHTFIKMFDDKQKYNENPKIIIDIFNGKNSICKKINGNDSLYKMIRLYIYI